MQAYNGQIATHFNELFVQGLRDAAHDKRVDELLSNISVMLRPCRRIIGQV